MSIQKAEVGDAPAIKTLIFAAVDPENNSDFDQQGIINFKKPNRLDCIKKRIVDLDYLTLCYWQDGVIVGIITLHLNSKLDQLFVAPTARRQGVATALWHSAKQQCMSHGGNGQFWVKSSSVAVPLYQSFGFQLDGERQQSNGMIFYPMSLC